MNDLAVLGIALLALVVGIGIGVRLTARRYRRALNGEVHDIGELLREGRRGP